MSRRDSSRITPVLQRQYRDAAHAGDWVRCRILAEQMRGLERDNALAAEAAYALGFALEMLGERDKASAAYEHALVIDRAHGKARRRLAMLRRSV
jgi:tetratricopeptide (TPR) repeat protein